MGSDKFIQPVMECKFSFSKNANGNQKIEPGFFR